MQRALRTRTLLPVLLASLALVGGREAAAQRGTINIPRDTVIHATLDENLSSRTARVGDRVAARIDPDDRSGFPEGTRFEGTVTQVQRSNKNRPGIIDVDFRRAWLPDGQRVTINGTLASLGEDDVQRTADGRVVSRKRSGDSFDWKWVGYGAAGGAILGGILGDDWLKGGLLGGLGGAVYSYINRDKGGDREFRDVTLDRGTDFGIRLDNRVVFNDRDNYRYLARNDRFLEPDDRVLGERQELRDDIAVRMNNRLIDFGDRGPMRMNGILYVPLRPIAEAANWRFAHRRGDVNFTLTTPDGPVRGYAGEDSMTVRGDRTQRFSSNPISVNGEIYVPTEYLSRTAGLRVDWDRTNRRLNLETY